MSIIRPLRAIRYATDSRQLDVSTRIAPPYDVIDEAGKADLLAPDPKNFVKIDLPHMPPKSAGPPAAYAAAAATLQEWLRDGTMVRDERPALYVYHQRYQHAGTAYVRKMFFARLRLEAFGSGSVFPHERTFGGPKEDRLALTKATRANMSPIFGLYDDARNEVSSRLEQELPAPVARGTMERVENTLWAATDPALIQSIAELMQSKSIYIADGHHRYGTGLLYRDWLISQQRTLPDDHPANFVLCVFCAMEDPGLLILPTHRVLPGVRGVREVLAADAKLEVTALPPGSPDEAVRGLARLGPQAVGLCDGGGQCFAVRPRSREILDALEPSRTPAWRRLGLAFLHAYLLERVVTPKLCSGKEPTIQYIKSAPEAVRAAQAGGGAAFLMQPTTMEEMRDVCGAGDLMPQKSTYFFPKLASGLVINPLAD